MVLIEKHYRSIGIIGTIFIALIVVSSLIFGPFNEILPESWREKLGYGKESQVDQQMAIILYIDFNGYATNINLTIILEENQTASAYSILLLANLTIETETYPNGKFVKAIEGIAQTAENFWWYLFDEKNGYIASDKFDLRVYQVAKVSWLYKNYLREVQL